MYKKIKLQVVNYVHNYLIAWQNLLNVEVQHLFFHILITYLYIYFQSSIFNSMFYLLKLKILLNICYYLILYWFYFLLKKIHCLIYAFYLTIFCQALLYNFWTMHLFLIRIDFVQCLFLIILAPLANLSKFWIVY